MKLQYLAWIAIAIAMGCTSNTSSEPSEIQGAMVYANNCNRCHVFRSPTEFDGPAWSIITTHMRVIGGIPADESRAVYEYLKSQHHPPYIAEIAAARNGAAVGPEHGKMLVQGRGCIGCHVIEGIGGTMGPALDGVSSRRSQDYVTQQLLNPKTNNPASLMPNLGFNDSEAKAIWAYLETLNGRDGG